MTLRAAATEVFLRNRPKTDLKIHKLYTSRLARQLGRLGYQELRQAAMPHDDRDIIDVNDDVITILAANIANNTNPRKALQIKVMEGQSVNKITIVLTSGSGEIQSSHFRGIKLLGKKARQKKSFTWKKRQDAEVAVVEWISKNAQEKIRNEVSQVDSGVTFEF